MSPGTEPNGEQQVIEGSSDYGQDAGYGSIIPVGNGNSGPTDSPTTIIDSTGAQTSGAPAGTDQQGGQQAGTPQPGAKPFDSGQPAVPATGLTQQQPASQTLTPKPQPAAPGNDSSGGLY